MYSYLKQDSSEVHYLLESAGLVWLCVLLCVHLVSGEKKIKIKRIRKISIFLSPPPPGNFFFPCTVRMHKFLSFQAAFVLHMVFRVTGECGSHCLCPAEEG